MPQVPENTTTLRERIEQELRGAGLSDQPEKFDSDIHSWRCGYPESYGRGHCSCFAELVDDLFEAVREQIGIVITDQAVAWAGRDLTDDEVRRLRAAVPHSSVPEAIATIVDSFTETDEQVDPT